LGFSVRGGAIALLGPGTAELLAAYWQMMDQKDLSHFFVPVLVVANDVDDNGTAQLWNPGALSEHGP